MASSGDWKIRGLNRDSKNPGSCMRAVALVLVWLMFCSACSLISVREDETKKFRGIPWGASHQTIDDFEIIPFASGNTAGKNIRGFRKNENFRFADAQVDKIIYYFKNDRFYMARIEGHGYQNFSSILTHCLKYHGEPKFKNEELNIYVWSGEDVGVLLRFYKGSDALTLSYEYIPIKSSIPPSG